MSDLFGFDRPHAGGPRHISSRELCQRNFEEGHASTASKGSLTKSSHHLSVEDANKHIYQAKRLSMRIGMNISPSEKEIWDLANGNDEDDDTLEYTGFSLNLAITMK